MRCWKCWGFAGELCSVFNAGRKPSHEKSSFPWQVIPVTGPEAAGSGPGMQLGHSTGKAAQESRSGSFPVQALGYSVVLQ